MNKPQHNPDDPWFWPEERIRRVVGRVRAGKSLKPSNWPGSARCAVALSFDSDHETSTLRYGEVSPGQLSQGQYGSRVAVPRILELLARSDIKATFFVPAVVAMLHPEEQRRIIGEGHEIGIHSWIHEFNSTLPADVERDLQINAADTLETITGVRPVGIRTPSWDFSPSTLSIIREMGLLYDSSLMADDDPYELLENDEPTGVVELPVEWIRDDFPYFNMDRSRGLRPHTGPADVLDVFIREFEGARAECGLFLLTMHPHVIGHRSRIRLLGDLIDHIRGTGDVWFATHADVARWCLEQAD